MSKSSHIHHVQIQPLSAVGKHVTDIVFRSISSNSNYLGLPTGHMLTTFTWNCGLHHTQKSILSKET